MLPLVIAFLIKICLSLGFLNAISLVPQESLSSTHLVSQKVNCDKKTNNPFLWKITRNGVDGILPEKPAYLFGTIHVAYTRVWDYIPDIVMKTFREADNAYFELDLLEPSVTSDMNDCKYLPRGEKLLNILPTDLYVRLVNHLHYVRNMMPKWISSANRRYRGVEAYQLFRAKTAQWQRKRAVWTLLMIDSLNESDIRSYGTSTLDYYLAQEAQRMGKKTGAVESVEDQCEPLNNLNLTHVIFALNMTLLQQEKVRRGLVRGINANEALIDEYKCGNIDASAFNREKSLPADETDMNRQIENYFQEKFIKERNQKMTRKIISLLKTQPTKIFFFALGVAHFLGNNSIVDLLKAEGYHVERVVEKQVNVPAKNIHHIRKSPCSPLTSPSCKPSSDYLSEKIKLLRRDEKLLTQLESRNKRNHKKENTRRSTPKPKPSITHAHSRKIVDKLNRDLYKFMHGSTLNKTKVYVILPIERLSSVEGLNSHWSPWTSPNAGTRLRPQIWPNFLPIFIVPVIFHSLIGTSSTGF